LSFLTQTNMFHNIYRSSVAKCNHEITVIYEVSLVPFRRAEEPLEHDSGMHTVSRKVGRGSVVLWITQYIFAKRRNKQKQQQQQKLRGLNPQSNYTDRATAACRRS
jgi:hypothetical protein